MNMSEVGKYVTLTVPEEVMPVQIIMDGCLSLDKIQMLEANDDHLSLVSMEVNLNFHQTLHNDILIKIITA